MDWISLEHKPTIGLVGVVQRGYRGRAAALDLSVSFCIFSVLESAPVGPLADSREAIYSASNLNEPKTGQFHGNWVWSRQHVREKKKKKRAGEAVSVFKSGWGSVQWLPSSDTLTTQSNTHTQTLPYTDAYKLWTPDKLPPEAHTHTHWCLTVGQWHEGLRSWIMGTLLSSVIYLAAILR